MKIYRKTVANEIINKSVELVGPIAKSLGKRAFIFCESKSTLSFERAVSARFGGSFSVQVTSFSRYVSKNSVGINYVGKTQATLIIARILSEKKEELTRLKSNSFSTAGSVFELISQLKSAKVTPEKLDEIIGEESSALTFKLRDIKLIYRLYQDHLNANGLVDDSGVMDELPAIIKKDQSLKGAKVVVAGISNFTAQTLDAVEALDEAADLDCVVLSYDGDSALNESLQKLKKICPEATVVEEEKVYPVAITQIKERLYSDETVGDEGINDERVKIVECVDAFFEARFVARTIKREILDNGRRLRDFAIACPDVPSYEDAYLSAFSDYGLTLFADRTYSIVCHPAAALFSAIVDLKRFSARADVAEKLVSVGAAFSEEEAKAFRDYLSENAVPRYGLKKEFKEEKAEAVREKIVACFEKMPNNAPIARLIEAIKGIFTFFNVEENIIKIVEELKSIGEDAAASYLEQGEKAFYKILDDTEKLLGSNKVALKEFYDLVFSSLSACEISVLPQHNDNVYLGDYKSVKNALCPILFCVGLNGDTPFVKKDDALLNDKELSKLEGFKIVVEPKISIVNRRERENVAATLLSFGEKLFATYTLTGTGGEKAEKSRIIEYLLSAFTTKDRSPLVVDGSPVCGDNRPIDAYLTESAGLKSFICDAQAFRARQISDLEMQSSFLAALKERDDEKYRIAVNACRQNAAINGNEKLSYGGTISPSLTESFFTCPYKAFVEKILRVEETKTGELKGNDLGVLLHAVMEGFAPQIDNLSEVDVPAAAEKVFDEVLSRPEYGKFLEKKDSGFFLNELKGEAIKSCKRLFRSVKNSEFRLLGTEVKFGEGERFPAIEIETSFGKRRIRGTIDRVDVGENLTGDGKTYARIVDYKTGSAVFDKASVKNLYYGKNVQLYLYMNAVKEGGFEPAAVHYLELNDDFKKPDDKKVYAGYIVNDERILSGVDKNFEVLGKSEEYGSASPRSGTTCSEEEIESLLDYSKAVTASGAEEMHQGLFIASPLKGSCEYCKLKGSCRLDEDAPDLSREALSVRLKDVAAAMRGDDDEN